MGRISKKQPFGVRLSLLVKTRNVAQAWRVFCDGLEDLEYDHVIYSSNRLSPRGHGAPLDETLILVHGADDWAENYIDDELYLHSLTFEWAARNNGFASWQAALTQFGVHPSPKLIELRTLNDRFGLTSGHIGSLNAVVPGTRAIVGCASSNGWTHAENDAHWAKVGPLVEVLCETMHLRIASLPQTGIFRPLTARQLDVLFWYAEGKMVQDIATIMNIHVGTVEKHLRMAREALAADTTAHAVRKATALNLLVS